MRYLPLALLALAACAEARPVIKDVRAAIDQAESVRAQLEQAYSLACEPALAPEAEPICARARLALDETARDSSKLLDLLNALPLR